MTDGQPHGVINAVSFCGVVCAGEWSRAQQRAQADHLNRRDFRRPSALQPLFDPERCLIQVAA